MRRGRSPHRSGRGSPSNSSERGINQNLSQGPRKNQAQDHRYDKSHVQCNYCKNYIHCANECRKNKHDLSNKRNANFIKENQNQDNMLLSFNIAQDKQNGVWYLDLGCNNHMKGNI